jgi:ABC-type nitrate/sulfonate/bicarbonate transport system substrate-binding protein
VALAAILAAVVLATAVGASGGAAANQQFTVVIGSASADHAVEYVAKLQGYFEKLGLDVNIKPVGASNVITSLVAGQADVGVVASTGSALAPVSSGKQTTVIYNNYGGGVTGYIFGKPGVNSVSDCHKVGSLGLGSAPYAWATVDKVIFKNNWSVTPFGDQSTLTTALTGGSYDCAVATYGVFSALVNQGKVHVLFDPRVKSSIPKTFPPTLVEAAIYGLKNDLQAKRQQVVEFLRGYAQGLGYVDAHSSTQVATLMKTDSDFSTTPLADLADGISGVKPFFSPHGGYVTPKEWRNTLNFYGGGGLSFINNNPEWGFDQRVDMSYLNAAIPISISSSAAKRSGSSVVATIHFSETGTAKLQLLRGAKKVGKAVYSHLKSGANTVKLKIPGRVAPNTVSVTIDDALGRTLVRKIAIH